MEIILLMQAIPATIAILHYQIVHFVQIQQNVNFLLI